MAMGNPSPMAIAASAPLTVTEESEKSSLLPSPSSSNPLLYLHLRRSIPPSSLLLCLAFFAVFVVGAISALLVRNLVSAPNPTLLPSFSAPLSTLKKPTVVLISTDGFRWGYNWKVDTPNIDRIRANGTEAEQGMLPVYPSLTFPNHYSMATGLYPAWHGIVSNSFTDPEESSTVDSLFYQGNIDPKWWLGEPIWETVVKNGLLAATYFWPGSDVSKGEWNCSLPYCQHYNGSVAYEDRVDTVLAYFDLPPERIPSLITLYFEEPDHTGHQTGPDDPAIDSAITRIDAMIGRLLEGLDKRGIGEDVSLVLVSDHGMTSTCEKKFVYMEDFHDWVNIPPNWVDSLGPVLAIRPPVNVDPAEIKKNMSTAIKSGRVQNGEFLRIFLKEELPDRLHYAMSGRIQPIIGIPEEGYKIRKQRSRSKNECGGIHGYDNELVSMRAIFIGHGYRFAKGRKIPPFQNVEIYNLITDILGIKGSPNNGTLSFASSTLLLPTEKR